MNSRCFGKVKNWYAAKNLIRQLLKIQEMTNIYNFSELIKDSYHRQTWSVVLTITKNITCKCILSVAFKIYIVFVIINNLWNVFFSAVA